MNPPRLATWLLRTLGSGDSLDALLGDITEEFQSGKSRAWFWRQALSGIVVTFFSSVRRHNWLVLRAVGVAYVLNLAFRFALASATPWIEAAIWLYIPSVTTRRYPAHAYTFAHGVPVRDPGRDTSLPWAFVEHSIVPFLGSVVIALAIGWIVGKLHRRARGPAIIAVVAVLSLVSLVLGHRFEAMPLPDGDTMMVVPLVARLFAWAPITYASGILLGGFASSLGMRAVGRRPSPIS